MLKAIFETSKVSIGSDKKSVVVEGKLHEGNIGEGMFLNIAFNRSTGMGVPISKVENQSKYQMLLTLDCEHEEGANLVEAMNFENEYVEIQDEL